MNIKLAKKALKLGGVTLAAFLVATAVDVLSLRSGITGGRLLLLSNVVIAALAATAVIDHYRRTQQRSQILQERLETISSINHEIRTVLGVVGFYGTHTASTHALEIFDEAFQRMEVLLRTVLTKWSFIEMKPPAPLFFVHGSLRKKVFVPQSSVLASGPWVA